MPRYVTLLVSFISDFVITAGTGLSAAMVVQGAVVMPTPAVWLLACIGGLVAGARRFQALVQEPPR